MLKMLMPEKEKVIRKAEASNALKSVTPEKAFHFYREIGQPLGVSSRSLDDFTTVVKAIDPSCIKFHLERGDFEIWFTMLGDNSLAVQIATLRGKNISPDELRRKLNSMVRTRVDQLHKIAGSK